MSESIDPQTVERVARLAKIQLSSEQLDKSSTELAAVLSYVSQLDEVTLANEVEPFFGAIDSVNAIRSDELKPSTERQSILENAPATDGEFYVVPPVFK